MLRAVAFVPTPPLLVPALAGEAAADTQALRESCLRAARMLAEVSQTWVGVAEGTTETVLGPEMVGTWSGFGADVAVSLGPDPVGVPDRELPLSALVAGWLRDQAAPDASIEIQAYRRDTAVVRCAELGHALAADPRSPGLLVLGDGCTTLTAKAPGAFDPRAAAVQVQIDAALSSADAARLADLDVDLCNELGVSGRVPWQIAAAATGNGWHAEPLYSGAPYGVGYQVAVWRP